MIPHYHLHHPPRAITAVVVRAHYIQTGGLIIVVVVHQCRHCPPPPPSSPSRGWLLLGATCRHRHPHHCVHCRRNPTNNEITATLPCHHPPLQPPPTVAVAPSPLSRSPMVPSASMPSLPVRRGKCRSRTCPPRWDMDPLRQRRRHSQAAGGIPSFASRAAAAGQATATAARQR